MQIEPMRYERVPISQTALTVLCVFAAGDVNKPLPELEVNWQEVFDGVCRNGIVGLTHRYLKNQKSQVYPPPAFRQQIYKTAQLEVLKIALLYKKTQTILNYLTTGQLDFMVVKGPAVACTIYPERNLRPFNDLDIIVREQDWSKAHRLLLDMGFLQIDKELGQIDTPQPPLKLVSQAVPYELKYWHTQMNIRVEVHFDDILNCGLAARDVEGFWQRTSTIHKEGIPIKVMSLEDQLVHLCMHLHYHGYARLNAFSDIAFLVRDHALELNWERFLQIVRVEEAEVGVYYTLYFLQEMLQVSVLPQILAALRPDGFRRWCHNLLLPPQKVVSMQPMWRPDFSFYFTPLYKRLLPDMLVMGRRKEKARYLLRLAAPPRRWLQDYYQLDTPQQVIAYYLLHPLKLGSHYLAETLQLLWSLAP